MQDCRPLTPIHSIAVVACFKKGRTHMGYVFNKEVKPVKIVRITQMISMKLN